MAEPIREDYYHQRFKEQLKKIGVVEGKDFEQYVTSNPDFVFTNYSVLGEVKRKDGTSAYKSAFREIQNRNGNYAISNFDYFFVLTDKWFTFYRVSDFDWSVSEFTKDDIQKYVTRFENCEQEVPKVWEYIKNNCQKIYIERELPDVLDSLLSQKYGLSVGDAFYIILHLDTPNGYSKKYEEIRFAEGTNEEHEIENVTPEAYNAIQKEVLDKYKVKDAEAVKDYIRHNYSSHLSDRQKSNLGKYYTPKILVDTVYKMVSPYIADDAYVADIFCGCGAFMKEFDKYNLIGRDIDKDAIDVLDLMGYRNIAVDNSFFNVSREKYGISKADDLVIVGNPPYNDTTSKNKRFGTKAKTQSTAMRDPDVDAKDLGIVSLKVYAKLNPSYICVLHPLSYLIKKANFSSLGDFANKYQLIDATIFPSSLFKDLKRNSEFPIVAALYRQGKMTYEDMKSFTFRVLNSTATFSLRNFITIDDLQIDTKLKYPTIVTDSSGKHCKASDINLYQYNIRDTNSLLSSGNIIASSVVPADNYVTIDYKHLGLFAFLHCYRNSMQKIKEVSNDFYLIGNLSPIVEGKNVFDNAEMLDLMTIGTIYTDEHRLSPLNTRDKNSIVYTRFFYNNCKKKARNFSGTVNYYQIFVDYCDDRIDKSEAENLTLPLIDKYFSEAYKHIMASTTPSKS